MLLGNMDIRPPLVGLLHRFLVKPYQRGNFKTAPPPQPGRSHKTAYTKEEEPKKWLHRLLLPLQALSDHKINHIAIEKPFYQTFFQNGFNSTREATPPEELEPFQEEPEFYQTGLKLKQINTTKCSFLQNSVKKMKLSFPVGNNKPL